ncbi:probable protein precursor [Cephalotrichum gorgonifer]|uniref:Probable protein n=1 Tax=Cephalotrichum gorgonifer TaxID=2041049 RepID=A0AAE8MQT6_9PEZI|nr:probable protein precursor [Cephalotrichum gorgonifer]
MLLLFTISVFFLVVATALFFTRARWVPHVSDLSIPGRDYLYSSLPDSFLGDAEAGLSSSTFDLSGNIESGDGRAGLDDQSKAEILKIMKKRRLKFDDARKVYMENRFKANGIGPDGRPRDPKFVSFS